MKKSTRRLLMVTAICGGSAALFLLLIIFRYEPLAKLEFATQDLRQQRGAKAPADPRLVLLGINQPTYDIPDEDIRADPVLANLRKSFPWSRAVWADVITRLAEADTKVIVIDLLFAGQSDGDEALQAALDKYRDRVVIVCNINDTETEGARSLSLDLPNKSILNTTNTAACFDDRVGFDNVWNDSDGVLRHARYRLDSVNSGNLIPPGTVMESLAARAVRKFGHPELIPPGFEPTRFRYTGQPGVGYPVHPLSDILISKVWQNNYQNGAFFKGKIVMIGPTSQLFHDLHRTPWPTTDSSTEEHERQGSMFGPEVHLNLIGAALHGAFLHDPPRRETAMLIALAGLVAAALSFFIHQPFLRLLAIAALCGGYWALGQALFNRAGMVIAMAGPLLALGGGGVLTLAIDYLLEQIERSRTRKTLERYVSKNIVSELLDNPATYFNTLGGVRKNVAILFSDIRGFTTMTEKTDSERELVLQLNEYLQEMVRQVFKYDGTLDKFIGDAVMAVWGNILAKGPDRDACNAVGTALAMKRSLAALNADWKRRGIQELSIGIGINYGECIVGNLGSAEKMELTVIGDTVNLASRLEGLTKKFELDLLLGETVAPLVRGQFVLRTIALVQAKGKTKPIEVFTVVGERGSVDAKFEAWLARYEEAVKLYRARKFSEALRVFQECLHTQPDDHMCKTYANDCEALIQSPPDESWDAVLVMTEK